MFMEYQNARAKSRTYNNTVIICDFDGFSQMNDTAYTNDMYAIGVMNNSTTVAPRDPCSVSTNS